VNTSLDWRIDRSASLLEMKIAIGCVLEHRIASDIADVANACETCVGIDKLYRY